MFFDFLQNPYSKVIKKEVGTIFSKCPFPVSSALFSKNNCILVTKNFFEQKFAKSSVIKSIPYT